jgi:hypothetical protein
LADQTNGNTQRLLEIVTEFFYVHCHTQPEHEQEEKDQTDGAGEIHLEILFLSDSVGKINIVTAVATASQISVREIQQLCLAIAR